MVLALFPSVVQIQLSKVVINHTTCSSSEALDHAGEVIAVCVAVTDEEDVLVALVELVAALGWVAVACGPHLTRGAGPRGWVSRVIGTRGFAVSEFTKTYRWCSQLNVLDK